LFFDIVDPRFSKSKETVACNLQEILLRGGAFWQCCGVKFVKFGLARSVFYQPPDFRVS
jgi:hypothetical protein